MLGGSSPSGSEEDYEGGTQAPLWDESGDDEDEPVQLCAPTHLGTMYTQHAVGSALRL